MLLIEVFLKHFFYQWQRLLHRFHQTYLKYKKTIPLFFNILLIHFFSRGVWIVLVSLISGFIFEKNTVLSEFINSWISSQANSGMRHIPVDINPFLPLSIKDFFSLKLEKLTPVFQLTPMFFYS